MKLMRTTVASIVAATFSMLHNTSLSTSVPSQSNRMQSIWFIVVISLSGSNVATLTDALRHRRINQRISHFSPVKDGKKPRIGVKLPNFCYRIARRPFCSLLRNS